MTLHPSFRRAARAALIAVVSVGACACGGYDAEETMADVGTAEEALSGLKAEAEVSAPLATNALSPSAAWIKSTSFTDGRGLVGFWTDGSPPKAEWAHGSGWNLSAPSWNAAHKWDDVGFVWPDPANECDVLDCAGGGEWDGYNTVAAALWTGLNDVAVLVGTGGNNTVPNTDIYIAGSSNGGQNFTKSRILSVPDALGEDTGGDVDPNSVHASLMYSAARMNSSAGTVAIPIYVIWRNTPYAGTPSWWMTKVTVGIDGTPTQTTYPKKVTVLPTTPLGHVHASITGWEDDQGGEHVHLAWAERLDQASNPIGDVACPSGTTLKVRWFLSHTWNYGDLWECDESSATAPCINSVKTRIDLDDAWRTCVGASNPSGNGFNVNNDRPNFVLNRGNGSWRWYYAYNKNIGGRQRIVLKKDTLFLFQDLWATAFTSSGNDPATGASVEDSWGQSLVIHPGTETNKGALALVWKNALVTTGLVRTAGTTSANFGTNWSAELNLAGASSNIEKAPGLYLGLMVKEGCVLGTCPGGPPPPSRQPFLAAWPDSRDSGTNNEVWARAFSH